MGSPSREEGAHPLLDSTTMVIKYGKRGGEICGIQSGLVYQTRGGIFNLGYEILGRFGQ